ncbi:Crp/Fnr family transcriptional regulator [Aquamicrobium segne]|uniref:Crp/Fnr family transcriptional regulator n=1 Tax=Aquamicrobium segne TaxID=469547 RepID=A0ABW0H0A6_9HYPH
MNRLDPCLIADLPPFEALEPDALVHIIQSARSSRVAEGAAIFEQDQEAQSFFLLLDGRVRVLKTTPDGQQVIMRYIMPGELMGIAQALGRDTYPATALAVLDCVVLIWNGQLWNEFVQKWPGFGLNTYKMVGVRLNDVQTQVIEMATQQVERRVAHALLRLAHQSGRKTDNGILIDFPISRQDIAEMTGTTLHTVSRLLTAWETKKLVSGGRMQVYITDPHALLLLAEGRT